ncbi:MAG: YdcF family protein [Bacteroidota bacterium]|nr:YdcF family protein [Bacteroidota bacterium]
MTVILFTAVANAWVLYITHKHIFFDCKEIPANEYALVLGTSKRMVGGNPNPYFYYRMEAAAELYKYDKVKKFILSGDNRTKYYNEPNDMKIALMELGIPDSVITLDIAGLRTFDSVLRSKEIYGLDKVTIVTQGFHSSRAVFIGQYFDIEASAFVAKNRPLNKSFKLMIREYFARTKAVIDIVLSRFETFL